MLGKLDGLQCYFPRERDNLVPDYFLSEVKEVNLRLKLKLEDMPFYVLLVLSLAFLHEFGHWVVYNFVFYPELYEYGLGAWFGISHLGLYVNYWCIHESVRFWVALGGLLFTMPFLLLWHRMNFVGRGIILGFIVYGIWEVLFL